MSDYAAAGVQPLVQGLVTVSALGGAVTFSGKGATLVGTGRDGINPQGVFVLTLDAGLPGNAGAIEPLPEHLAAPAAPLARSLIQVRAPIVAGLPVPTTLVSVSVAYGNFTVPAPADGGLRQVMVLLALDVGTLTDPFTPDGNGFEIIVWAGVEAP